MNFAVKKETTQPDLKREIISKPRKFVYWCELNVFVCDVAGFYILKKENYIVNNN